MKAMRLSMIVAAAWLAVCCGGQARSTDGNTSWMRQCSRDGDCSGALSCICGVCTTEAELCGVNRECVAGRCVAALTTPPAPRDAGVTVDPSSLPSSSGPAGLATCTDLVDPLGGKGARISLRNDILPMFGLSCVTSDCHNAADPAPRAGLNLGRKCAYDPNAKWKCSFPARANADPTQPQPLDEETVAAVYASLLAPSTTVAGGAVSRVKPGDPRNSFLVLKLANQQNSRGFACVNQDSSHETEPPSCGVSMPQDGNFWCTGITQPRFDAVVKWIAQGAENN